MSTVQAQPYAWPFHGRLRPEQTAVLIVSGDCSEQVEAVIIRRLHSLVDATQRAGMTIVLLPRAGARWVVPIGVPAGSLLVPRPHLGAFTGTDLDLVLRNRGLRDLLIAGFPFELGADCTMREANDLGYECLLLEDCCSGLTGETFAGAIKSVQMSGGIFGAVATANAVLQALARLKEGTMT